jgi:hypothetical protein
VRKGATIVPAVNLEHGASERFFRERCLLRDRYFDTGKIPTPIVRDSALCFEF